MEAARNLTDLPELVRMRRFTADCEKLRPLGVAYVLHHFGGSLDLADAEDAVAEVIIRFHRLASAGRPPDRLRPAFFQSVRNAALDLLRYRGIRPTAPLEAAAETTTEGPGPEQHAEARDDLARLREAMARMSPRYREVIALRFGLDLSVPQIAAHLGVSLPTAKKLVHRSTAQIHERMEAIDGRQFCPEMRELSRRSVLGGEIAGLSEGAEGAAIRAHLEHCGACRGFLAALRSDLHELGGAALLAGLVGGKLGLPGRLLSGLHAVADAAHAGVARVRLASYRAGGALTPEGSGSAGPLAGTGQKLAAVCTAGAASAATCLATGIVGPGLGVTTGHHVDPHPARPSAHVRKAPTPVHRPAVSYLAPSPEPESPSEESTLGSTVGTVPRPRGQAPAATRQPKARSKPEQARRTESEPSTPAQTEQSEFGFEEEGAAPAAPAPEPAAPVTESRTVEAPTPATSSSSEASKGSSSSSGSGGHEEFGFGG